MITSGQFSWRADGFMSNNAALACSSKYTFLLEVLERVGFSRRWQDWVASLLSSASTYQDLVGEWTTGKEKLSRAARGLRQLPRRSVAVICDCHGSPQCASCPSGQSRSAMWPLPEEVIKHRMSLYVDDLVIFLLHAAKGGLHLHSVPFLICSQGHQA